MQNKITMHQLKLKSLIIATLNKGKLKEITNLFSSLPFEIKSLSDYSQIGSFSETGKTFLENARIKAQTVHEKLSGYVLADDSGLSCDDLEGAPGVDSAYFAGPKATDDENNQMLLKKMSEIHDPSRRARYVCVLVLITPDGQKHVVEETCEGMITFTPSGSHGFGYDPYFFLPEKNCTMADLSLKVKNTLSHRGKALKKMAEILNKLMS